MKKENDLTDADAKALREVARGGLMQKVIPDDRRDRLIKLKYIEQKLGGLAATAKGKRYAASRRRFP